MAKKLLTTGKGLAIHPHLLVPDTKFNPAGLFHTKHRQSGGEAIAFKKIVDDAISEAYKQAEAQLNATVIEAGTNKAEAAKAKKALKGLKRADPPYTDNEDGTIDFTFKMLATGKNKKGEVYTRKPLLFDAKGTPITGNIKLGGGSEIKISYLPITGELNKGSLFYTALIGAGVSLKLAAVQIIKLVEFGADAGYYGFQAEEGDEIEGAPEAAGVSAVQAEESVDEDADGNDDF